MLSSIQNSPSAVVPEFIQVEAENDLKTKNFRTTETNNLKQEEQDNLYFFGQHLNTPGLLLDEYPAYYDSNFEVANRAFYATINKFTRQSCPDASKRRSPPYSFLENWHLHSIYSKSQQTLLGITPVRPSVLLSGDDFMFTPPFIQQEPEEEHEDYMEDDEEDWEDANDFYSLSPCPDSNQAANLYYFNQENQENHQDIMTLAAAFPTSTTTPSSSSLFEISPNTTATNNFFFQEQQQEQEYFYSFGADDRPIFSWLDDDSKSQDLTSAMSHCPALAIHTDNSDGDDILNLDPLSPEEPDLSVCSSSSDDQQEMSSSRRSSISSLSISNMFSIGEEINTSTRSQHGDHDLNNATLIDRLEPDDIDGEEIKRQQQDVAPNSPVTRSGSFLSQKSSLDDNSSIMSYQSLADLIKNNSRRSSTNIILSPPKSRSYGSIDNQKNVEADFTPIADASPSIINSIVNTLYNKQTSELDEEMGIQHTPLLGDTSLPNTTTTTTFWGVVFIYIMSLWQTLVYCAESLGRLAVSPFHRFSSTEREPLL